VTRRVSGSRASIPEHFLVSFDQLEAPAIVGQPEHFLGGQSSGRDLAHADVLDAGYRLWAPPEY